MAHKKLDIKRPWKCQPCVVFVQSMEVVDCQEDAESIDGDPDDVEDIMPIGSLDQGTRGFVHDVSSVGSQGSTQKCRAKIDCNTRKPGKKIILGTFLIVNILWLK